jgi:hypothetical protein
MLVDIWKQKYSHEVKMTRSTNSFINFKMEY